MSDSSSAARRSETWTPRSWRSFPIKQQPPYPDMDAVETALETVRALPPLVTPSEVDALRVSLGEAARGERFLLQGGDCAERFADCTSTHIEQTLKILLQMSLVLTWGARTPTVRVARMAGQFAKPRSKDTEVVDGVEYVAFRGDNVNSFDTSARTPDPARLVQGYFHSACTLNYARALLAGGIADLHAASHWDLGFVQDEAHRAAYKTMVDRILSALDFMRVCGVGDAASLKTADVFVSHEGLQLAYEEALTRSASSVGGAALTSGGARVRTTSHTAPSTPVHPPAAHSSAQKSATKSSVPSSPALTSVPGGLDAQPTDYYNLGTHFLWIGDRTRQIDHAHVEYFRGIANPIGIKVGPSSDPAEVVELIRRLWPRPLETPGKIVLISRFGASQVRAKLPAIVKAVQAAAFANPVLWTCDPMHGNTHMTSTGLKTRDFDDILAELRTTFEVHAELGSRLGGVHFELTGENVTECTGGPEKLLEHDLPRRYTTYCDPRLNYAQGMELAFIIAQYLADARETELVSRSGMAPSDFVGASDRIPVEGLDLAASATPVKENGVLKA